MLYPYYICAPYGLALEEREAIKHVVVTKSTTRFVLTHPPNSRRQQYYNGDDGISLTQDESYSAMVTHHVKNRQIRAEKTDISFIRGTGPNTQYDVR